MSFSLSVYVREYTEEIDRAWMSKCYRRRKNDPPPAK